MTRAVCRARRYEGGRYLENEHAEGLPQDLVAVLVVRPADVCLRDEQLERVLRRGIVRAALLRLFDLSHALLPVGRKPQLQRSEEEGKGGGKK